jgi:cation diffusion facilitator CzcD-associated flavoprotein CzcO
LNDPKIELTTLKISSVGEKSVTLGPQRDPNDETVKAPNHQVTIPADVIILANGFETTQWFHPITVIGREGQKLNEVFKERGGAQMYMGMAMDGFPNFFTIFGPNTVTGHSSVILASENMVEMSLKFIKPIINGDVAETEIKKEAELDWAADTQRACNKTVVNQGGCRNWYHEDSGWNSTIYP